MPTTSDSQEVARQLRVDSIRTSTAAGSGHPTSALSAADLLAVLLTRHLRYDFANPSNPANDHLIFSKGHASSLVYAVFKAAGAIEDDAMMTYRKFGSPFQGHPTPVLPWVDVATGSLGQGLPIGVGVALAGKQLDKLPYTVWVVCGDSELAEGSIWEAFDKAGYYDLDNLVAIIDMNRFGQRGETEYGWDGDVYASRAEAFGWHAIQIDGHDHDAIDAAYREALEWTGSPVAIIARTKKGKGVALAEDQPNWHGKALSKDQAAEAIAALGGESSLTVDVHEPAAGSPAISGNPGTPELPTWELGAKHATRQAYGDALKALGGSHPKLVVLDAEVSNSTFAEIFKFAYPERFFEMWIAEQQMVAAAVGMQVRGYTPFASTFGAFMSRAYDFVRMAAVSRASIRLCGSHAGVSIGEDGPSQMALEDIAMMRAVHGSAVLYPSDPNQTVQLVAAMAEREGISYIRTTRAATPVIYDTSQQFTIGGSHTVRSSEDDQVTIVAAGITLHEAISACDTLAGEGINARLIDLYSVKPLDDAGLAAAVRATNGRVVVAEDHWPEGGIGSAVLDSLAASGVAVTFRHLAPREMPGSGTPAQLLDAAGISAAHIAAAARELVG